jgi:hypothetical protein
MSETKSTPAAPTVSAEPTVKTGREFAKGQKVRHEAGGEFEVISYDPKTKTVRLKRVGNLVPASSLTAI